jgi:hypothetical protein
LQGETKETIIDIRREPQILFHKPMVGGKESQVDKEGSSCLDQMSLKQNENEIIKKDWMKNLIYP